MEQDMGMNEGKRGRRNTAGMIKQSQREKYGEEEKNERERGGGAVQSCEPRKIESERWDGNRRAE